MGDTLYSRKFGKWIDEYGRRHRYEFGIYKHYSALFWHSNYITIFLGFFYIYKDLDRWI